MFGFRCGAGVVVLGISSFAGVACAQSDYPTKPVRMIVGFTPGSATDVIGRIFAQKFTEA